MSEHITPSDPDIVTRLPAMYFPMPWRCHADVELLEAQGLAFVERHGLGRGPGRRERVVGTRSALFFAGNCPDADAERLQMAVDWTYTMFVFDDFACDEESPEDAFSFLDLAVRVVRTLETPTAGLLPPENLFTGPVVELAERLHRLASATQRRRLVDAHLSWYLGVAWERAARGQRSMPNLNEYLHTRLLYVAGFPTLAWFQVSEGSDIPDQEINAPAVHALTEMAAMVAAIDDDLFSYGKELWYAARRPARTEPVLNLVALHQARYGCTPQDARRRAVALRDRILARFVEVRDLVLPAASEPLSRYVSNLTCLIRGNYEWGIRAARYTDPDGRHPGAVRVATCPVADVPSATGAPPEAPSIGWWWHALPTDASAPEDVAAGRPHPRSRSRT
ncbi:terpene synthase family protein [Streptomyces fragilis]|uniref:Glutamate dehydrogenase n=1 Tax=Streptomyces fragilis TaxID=67301 RepID=A0ABV2YCY1_9ACTN|nr:glutamate dehydrogenase [Streptomyces fragilis]